MPTPFTHMQLVATLSNEDTARSASVLWDAKHGEYRVKLFTQWGIPCCPSSDIFDADLEVARTAAARFVNDRAAALGAKA